MTRCSYLFFLGFCALFLWWIWNLNPVEEIVGSWLASRDPLRQIHLKERLKMKSDQVLLKLLHHGDYYKALAAASILLERADKAIFEDVARKLRDRSFDVRNFARRILPYLDKERAMNQLMEELAKFKKDSEDYFDLLFVLARFKHKPVLPYLLDYAESEDGYLNGSVDLLMEFHDPKALPILRKLYEKARAKNDRYQMTEIKLAIVTLETASLQPGQKNLFE